MRTKFWLQTLKEGDYSEDLSLDGKIIQYYNIQEYQRKRSVHFARKKNGRSTKKL